MRQMTCSTVAILLAGVVSMASGQAGDQKALLLRQLRGQFVPTKFSADNSEVVTPGAVVALKRDGLLTYPVSVPVAPVSVFKKDKLSQGFGDMLAVDIADGLGRAGGSSGIPKKTIVAGEKVSVRDIEIAKDSILVQVVTEPYDDGRYFGTLKFLFPRGSVPAPGDAINTISEVLEVQQAAVPPETASAAAAAIPPSPPPHQYQDIAPPPPPPAPAPTVSLGEPKSQVATDLGEPQRKAVVGAKEIFFYSDLKMKITFSGGKVTNVE